MRAIKFRVWDKIARKMYQLEDWYYSGEYQTINMSVAFDDEDRRWQLQDEDLELMQFTGLADKNGTPIYESDIVQRVIRTSRLTSSIFTVRWKDTEAGFSLTNRFGNTVKSLEVIGNIWENPDLLTKP